MDVFVRLLNALLMIAAPLVLATVLIRRLRVTWRPFVIGALTFLGAQILHLPFNARVLAPALARLPPVETHPPALLLTALAVGLSAGVFEELGRALALRYALREARTWRQTLMFGAGHGGVEAILLGALAGYALLQAITLRGSNLTSLVPPSAVATAQAQLDAYWALPWHAVLLGALERVFALAFHLSAATLVLQAFRRRNPLWTLAAIVWHTLLDAVAVIGVTAGGVYVTEALIGLMALLACGIVIALRPRAEAPAAARPGGPTGPDFEALRREAELPSPERLEDSRYE